MLTTVLNDSPVVPDDTEEEPIPILMDSPQCVFFGIFIIWYVIFEYEVYYTVYFHTHCKPSHQGFLQHYASVMVERRLQKKNKNDINQVYINKGLLA